MSVFGRGFYQQPEPNFSGLFRLIDDWDRYANQTVPQNGNGTHTRSSFRHVQTFTPKFDLKETESTFELHGDLPGLDKDNVHIEFDGPQSLVIRGRVERSSTSGTPPAGFLEDSKIAEDSKMTGAITQEGEHAGNDHHATVEDEPEEGAAVAKSNAPVDTPGSTALATPASNNATVTKESKPQHKYWISERSVGEFVRKFTFPDRVDIESVGASLKDGVLTVVVPKAKKHESRRIAIN